MLRPFSLILVCSLVPPVAHAQTTSSTGDPVITFTMPLVLDKISSDIRQVAVYCRITSSAIPGRTSNTVSAQADFFVRNGQLYDATGQQITTATVPVIATGLDPNASGQQASYSCSLSGYSMSLQKWDAFDAAHAVPAFRLSPTPAPLTGSFVW
jgi:hypothetical protein